MYFNPMDTSLTRTPVRTWVETAKALRDAHGFHLGGVNVHIRSPHLMSDRETAVIQHVNRFPLVHEQYPVSAVANTIFPLSLDHGDGADVLAECYTKTFKRSMKSGWG